jgi:hypothetical protein
MSIFTGAPIKSRVGTKSDVVRCGKNCLSYNANNGSLLSARCRGGSARHNILERLRTAILEWIRVVAAPRPTIRNGAQARYGGVARLDAATNEQLYVKSLESLTSALARSRGIELR